MKGVNSRIQEVSVRLSVTMPNSEVIIQGLIIQGLIVFSGKFDECDIKASAADLDVICSRFYHVG